MSSPKRVVVTLSSRKASESLSAPASGYRAAGCAADYHGRDEGEDAVNQPLVEKRAGQYAPALHQHAGDLSLAQYLQKRFKFYHAVGGLAVPVSRLPDG